MNCPKCTSGDVDKKYGQQGTDEWLSYTCRECRHTWQTPVAGSSDFRKKP